MRKCEGKTRYYASHRIREKKWQFRPCRCKGVKHIVVRHRGKIVLDKYLCHTHRNPVEKEWTTCLLAEIEIT